MGENILLKSISLFPCVFVFLFFQNLQCLSLQIAPTSNPIARVHSFTQPSLSRVWFASVEWRDMVPAPTNVDSSFSLWYPEALCENHGRFCSCNAGESFLYVCLSLLFPVSLFPTPFTLMSTHPLITHIQLLLFNLLTKSHGTTLNSSCEIGSSKVNA